MVLDVIGIILIILFFIRGYTKGFIVAVFSVLALLLGAVCALALSHQLSRWLIANKWVSSAWAQGLSYIVLFIGVVMLVKMVAKMLEGAAKTLMLGTINMLIGGILYGLLGTIFWSALLWVGTVTHIIAPETIAASKTYGALSQVAPWVFTKMGDILPFAKGSFVYFDNLLNSLNK